MWIAAVFIGLAFWLVPVVLLFMTSESSFDEPTDRVLWFIVVFFLPPVGGVLYWVRRFWVDGLPSLRPVSHRGHRYEARDLKRSS